MADPLCDLSAIEQARLIGEKQLSPVELMQSTLERIGQIQPALNPFCFVFDDEALAAARRAEQAVMRGKRTTRGSAAFEHWVPEHDPPIVRRLLAAGAIMVGKTTTPEFAYASFTRSRLWGITPNPWDPTRTPGGSSGCSGVAVTTGCAALVEGTDMGGSVRIPAALCGCVGLKPSLGRIPMDILPTVFDSISLFGPLARTVDDAALFLRVTEGPDEADIRSQTAPATLPARLATDLSDLRIAHSTDLGIYAVDPEVAANLEAVAEALRSAGAVVEPVELDWAIEYVTAWNEMWGVYLAAAFGGVVPAYRDRMDPAVVALIEAGQRLAVLPRNHCIVLV